MVVFAVSFSLLRVMTECTCYIIKFKIWKHNKFLFLIDVLKVEKHCIVVTVRLLLNVDKATSGTFKTLICKQIKEGAEENRLAIFIKVLRSYFRLLECGCDWKTPRNTVLIKNLYWLTIKAIFMFTFQEPKIQRMLLESLKTASPRQLLWSTIGQL